MDFRKLKDKLAHLSRYNVFLYKEINKIREWDALGEHRQRELKNKRAYDFVRYAYKHSEFYHSLYKQQFKKGYDQNDFFNLPTINKWDIIRNNKTISTVPLFLLKEGKTSGTSGTPMSVYRSPAAIIRDNAYVWFFRESHGLRLGEPIVVIRGKMARDEMYHYNRAENSLYLSAYHLSKKNIPLIAKLVRNFQPSAICAWPSSVFTLVNLLISADLSLKVPLVFTASETLYGFQRKQIEGFLGAKIYDYYGNAERSIALGQCRYGNYHEMPLYSINEFLEKGVLTTALMSKSYPIIRYRIDDYFVMTEGICECGKSLGVKNIDGREDDVVLATDGTIVTGLSRAFHGVQHLLFAQIIQDAMSSIQVNIVPGQGFCKSDERQIFRQLREKIGDALDISFNRISEHELIKSNSGKFQLVISRIQKNKIA